MDVPDAVTQNAPRAGVETRKEQRDAWVKRHIKPRRLTIIMLKKRLQLPNRLYICLLSDAAEEIITSDKSPPEMRRETNFLHVWLDQFVEDGLRKIC